MADLRLVSGNDNSEPNNGDVVQIWERQLGETSKAFAAFEAYRDMGPERSLSKVAQKLGKSTPLLSRWSRHHDWQRRVSAFARYETKVINDRIVEGVAAMRERQALLGQQLQQRGQARILKMNEQEIDQLHPVDAAALLRAGAELERKAREVEDGESVGGWDMPKPTFTIQIINLPPLETHARVQLDGEPGVVARDQLDRFKADFPEAVILC